MHLSALPYAARQFNPAHPDLRNAAGVPAQLASEGYVAALAHVVYFWGYPGLDTMGRTSAWELMKKSGPGAAMGLFPAAPKNRMGYLDDYLSAAQRKVVTPNGDTLCGVALCDLGKDSVVVQTPEEVPAGHYWSIQIVDVFTTVIHRLGSACGTPGGKLLLVGPGWKGDKPEGFIDVLRSPSKVASVFGSSFAARTPEAKRRARSVLNQIGVVPLKEDRPGRFTFDCEASARNSVYPPGLTAQMLAADPDLLRGRCVNVATFWDDLRKLLDANPDVSADDAPMADHARTLLALHESDASWRALLERAVRAADVDLHEVAKYQQAGVAAAGGWQRQENGGAWKTDWFGRALAAVIHVGVDDCREVVHSFRGTDAQGELLQGRYRYTMQFAKDALPPVDRARGGFWSLTMYDQDYYMVAESPNGRHNIGTVNLDAKELKFGADGTLTLYLSHGRPASADAQANWLPAPAGQFALLVRMYVPTPAMLDGGYELPDVEKTARRETPPESLERR